uniref:Uncharacterized protein n=1 Tax=Arundo donax TaxID=35708 RepID=A0A0A9DAN8_ARUDO
MDSGPNSADIAGEGVLTRIRQPAVESGKTVAWWKGTLAGGAGSWAAVEAGVDPPIGRLGRCRRDPRLPSGSECLYPSKPLRPPLE